MPRVSNQPELDGAGLFEAHAYSGISIKMGGVA
jgi:hypothetical protein